MILRTCCENVKDQKMVGGGSVMYQTTQKKWKNFIFFVFKANRRVIDGSDAGFGTFPWQVICYDSNRPLWYQSQAHLYLMMTLAGPFISYDNSLRPFYMLYVMITIAPYDNNGRPWWELARQSVEVSSSTGDWPIGEKQVYTVHRKIGGGVGLRWC